VVVDCSVVLCHVIITDEPIEFLSKVVAGIVMRLFLGLKFRLVISVKNLNSGLAVGLDFVVHVLEHLVKTKQNRIGLHLVGVSIHIIIVILIFIHLSY
jgi:hypothetical protein